MNVADAIKSRISTRAYKPDPLPESLVREILDVARWSPSGGNVQPWKVIAVAGAQKQAIVDLALPTIMANPRGEVGERFIYPENLWEPHKSWRFAVGEEMYRLVDIPREDKAGRMRWFSQNYQFFGAPVALFFVIDKRMGYGQWAHMGMFMQSITLAAQERGVANCMQECWAMLRDTLHAHFELPENEMIYCGMALGYADPTAAVNQLRTARAEVDEFTSFRGF
ncbi:MAG: nitroreductase [Caulobacterales bacterium]